MASPVDPSRQQPTSKRQGMGKQAARTHQPTVRCGHIVVIMCLPPMAVHARSSALHGPLPCKVHDASSLCHVVCVLCMMHHITSCHCLLWPGQGCMVAAPITALNTACTRAWALQACMHAVFVHMHACMHLIVCCDLKGCWMDSHDGWMRMDVHVIPAGIIQHVFACDTLTVIEHLTCSKCAAGDGNRPAAAHGTQGSS